MTDPTSVRPPLHTLNPLQRFSNRAGDYARARPSYPPEAIARVLDGLGEPATLTVADVGAGTGISSRQLADQGLRVWAIEPNPAMQQAGAAHTAITPITATAEATGLPDQSVALVTCFQSFHWFRQDEALAEFHRILQPGGRVALIWNDRDLADPFTRAYTDVLRSHSDADLLDRSDRKSSARFATHPQFWHYRTHTIAHAHPLDAAGLLGLALSSSYVHTDADTVGQLTREMESLYTTWATAQDPLTGAIPLRYQTQIYLAEAKHIP